LIGHPVISAAIELSRVVSADALLPAVFVRIDDSGRVPLPAALDLAALRMVSPLFAVRGHAGWQDARDEVFHAFDTVIHDDALRRRAEVSLLVAAQWRRRLATRLERLHTCRVMTEALSMCGQRLDPPSTVGELARAAGVSREHFTRTLRAHGKRSSFCAKRLVDAFVVLQVLVMAAMGVSNRRAAFESRIPYRSYLRARDRLEESMPGSTANFRALFVHVDVHLSV
jgi:hypothetical protein